MTDVSQRIASLSPKQRALLERRLQAAGLKSTSATSIPVLPKSDAYELSFGQQRLWFIDQLAPGSPAYNIPFAGRLQGPLEVDLLQRALDEIVRRHEILRTTFPIRGGKPVQVVVDSANAPLRFDDLTSLPRDAREAEAEQRVNDEARIPFDLAHGPVLRIRLIRIEPDDHMLLVTMPHIVTDAWSTAVFFHELPALYEAFAAGKPSPLPELPIQFRDYAAWQRGELQGEKLDPLIEFWKRELDGAPTLLELPGDFPRPAVHRFRGLRHAIDIPRELTHAVRELAQREGVTLYMMMVAALAILLKRYTGHDDILVGSPVATRERVETEGLIGFFINTLVVRTELKENPAFRELLGRVRERCLAAFAHQELPFERLVEVLGLDRDLSHQPLVQVTLVLQNVHIPPPQFERLRLTHFQQTDSRTAKVDLMLGLWESGEDLNGWLEYNVDLFAYETIERMGRHFVTLLQSIVSSPDRAIAGLTLIADEERRLLEMWNDTTRDYPREKTIGELFDEQVALRPAIALEMGAERLTYRELAARADELAAQLHGASRVGILIDRSIDLVVAMLATIKAGAAYVPLDPSYPEERLRYMIEDAEVDVVLRNAAVPPAGPAASHRRDDNLAYIMYTSGSTGRPKGVMVPHRAVVRLVKSQTYANLDPVETFLQFAPSTFDAATFEIWGALLNGARLVIQPPGRASLDDLGETIAKHGVTTLWLTAGLFHAIVDERIDVLRGVRQLLAGGDVLSAAHVKRVLREIPGITVINGYGPTEATTFTCCHRVSDPEAIGATVPIGKPIANTTAYVFDCARQPVPIGVPGELYIGGDGLAIGYTGGEAFGDLYRTGDRVRWNSSGELEFLGRFDNQLKIRGFRIEPGEIESALREHADVDDVVVVAREKTLVAYVIPNREDGEGSPDSGEDRTCEGDSSPSMRLGMTGIHTLREHLRTRVPEHMVPAQIVTLDAFPLTANGKVDRRALAALPIERSESIDAKPRGDGEEVIAKIWRDVLKLDHVGIHDNFFDLGGDSILGLLVVSRACDAGLTLTPAALFENPTVAGLAEAAARAATVTADSEPAVGPLPLTPIAHWFFEHVDRDLHHWNMAVSLRCRGGTDPLIVEEAITALIAHHDALRLRAERDHAGRGRMWIVPVEDEPPFRLQRIRRDEVDALQASLDLVAGPIVRAAWFETDADPELLLVVHHLAVDAVSWRILLDDLERAYEKVALRQVTTSLRSWSRRLSETITFDDQLDYWRDVCARDVVEVRDDQKQSIAREVAIDLENAQRAYRMTVDEIILAAFVRALHPAGGIRIDVEHHGRTSDADLSRTVGWFTTIAPVFFENATLLEIKERVRSIPERGIGFGALRYLRGHAFPSSAISFNYLGTLDALGSPASRFAVADFPTGAMRSPRARAPHRLSLDAFIFGGTLRLHLTGGDALLADALVAELHTLVAEADAPSVSALTPSDFPEADLDADELERLMGSLQGRA